MEEIDLYLKLLGEHLRRYRSANDLSQEELAYRTGLHDKYIGRVERGIQQPSFSTMHRLSSALGFSMDQIAAAVVSEMPDDPPSD